VAASLLSFFFKLFSFILLSKWLLISIMLMQVLHIYLHKIPFFNCVNYFYFILNYSSSRQSLYILFFFLNIFFSSSSTTPSSSRTSILV
jgi:hypothetical protein